MLLYGLQYSAIWDLLQVLKHVFRKMHPFHWKCSRFQVKSLKNFSVLKHILQKLKALFYYSRGLLWKKCYMFISKMVMLMLDQNNGIGNFHVPQRGATPFGFVFFLTHVKKTVCKIPTFIVNSIPFFAAAVGGNKMDNVFCVSSFTL